MSRRQNISAKPFPMDAQSRSLIWELSKRDIFGRYRGAGLGVIWSVLTPFLMLGVYTLAFGQLLRAKWPGAESSEDIALILFVGLAIHACFAECLVRAPSLVVANPSYVKKIAFPLEVLPWPIVISALFHLLMNILVFLVGVWFVKGYVPVTALFMPLVIIPLVPFLLAILWALGSIGVYLRDISQLTGPLATASLFLSSAIIPVSALPERHQWMFRLNPLTVVIDEARNVSLYGIFPSWQTVLIYSSVALTLSLLSYQLFKRLRKGFADVL